MNSTKIHGVCPHDCPDTCGLITEVVDGRVVDFYGNPDHPITQGWLCAKVKDYPAHVYHPDRLQYPLRRTGPKGGGQWQRISWEEALAEIGERWGEIIDRYGAEAILPYSYSGTLGMVQMGAASTRFWNRLGASQLQRSICGAAAEFAVEMTLGVRQSQAYAQVADSQLVILWGHNPVSTAPHFMPFLRRAQRQGTKLVVIDPRRSRSAKGADWHLAPIPASDGALALGLAHVIVREGWHDEAWLAAHTVGWPQLQARLEAYTPARVAQITGLAEGDIERLARLYATSQPALIKFSDGLQRNHMGGQTVRAICTLPALTGQYGRIGGGLAYSTSGYLQWDEQAVGHAQDAPPLGRWVNMNRLGAALLGEVDDPPVQSLFVFGSNPVATAPRAGKVVAGMRRADLFTVVHELFMTDTAALADIVLPATSQLEHADLHKAYGHTLVSYNAAAIPPLAEARSNWDMMRSLAAAMGFSDPWLQQTTDEVIAEVLAATAAENPLLAGITLPRLQQEGSISLAVADGVPFADGRFPTPSGKVELYSETMAQMGLEPLPGWTGIADDGRGDGQLRQNRFPPQQALTLISAAAHHFTTSTFANRADMRRREGDPFVEIHPEDAAARGIGAGDAVLLENGRGWCVLQARVTAAVRPGVVASPKGRWGRLENGEANGRTINWLTSDALGDMEGQSTFHSNQVWIRKR